MDSKTSKMYHFDTADYIDYINYFEEYDAVRGGSDKMHSIGVKPVTVKIYLILIFHDFNGF